MAMKKKLLSAGLATLALIATTAIASAAPAVVTGNVNVRSGPGTGYAVVDTLRRGERVDIQQCRGSWCYIEKRGPDGWVSANYLSSGGRPGWDDNWERPRPRPPHWRPAPPRPPHWNNPRPRPIYPAPNNPGASFCYNGPNGYFCVGS